jgi:AcrR family transcriptional regulator
VSVQDGGCVAALPGATGYALVMTGRRTQAERRAESRGRLIDAAIELLGTRGYAGTSLAEIGARAGLSRGLVNHHFGTKEACMEAVVVTIRNRVGAQLEKVGGTGLDVIDAVLDIYFAGLTGHPTSARAMYTVLSEAMTASPGLLNAVKETNALLRHTIAGHVREEIDSAGLTPAISPDVIAVMVEGMLRGVTLQWLADPQDVDLEAAGDAARMMVRCYLGLPAQLRPRARKSVRRTSPRRTPTGHAREG